MKIPQSWSLAMTVPYVEWTESPPGVRAWHAEGSYICPPC